MVGTLQEARRPGRPMHRPSRALLVAAVLMASILLAGCQAPSQEGFASGQMTAREAVELTQEQAKRWAPDAAVASVTTVELPPGSTMFEGLEGTEITIPPALVRLAQANPDAAVGDGKAPFWAVTYVAQDEPVPRRLVAYAANGTVRPVALPVAPQSVSHALGSWSIDSPAAVEASLENATFAQAARASDGGVLLTLLASGPADHQEAPTWSLLAASQAQATTSFLFVDARTGHANSLEELIRGEGTQEPPAPPEQAERDATPSDDRPLEERLEGVATVERFQGTVSDQAPGGPHELPAGQDLAWLQVTYRFTDDGPVPLFVRAEAQDPTGDRLISDHSGGGNTGAHAIFSIGSNGTYTTSLEAGFREANTTRSYNATAILWHPSDQDSATSNRTDGTAPGPWTLSGAFRPVLVPAIPQHPLGQLEAGGQLQVNLTWDEEQAVSLEPLLVGERGIGQSADQLEQGQSQGQLAAVFNVTEAGAYRLSVSSLGVQDRYAPLAYQAQVRLS